MGGCLIPLEKFPCRQIPYPTTSAVVCPWGRFPGKWGLH